MDAAISQVIAEQGRIDVLIHNAGHMVTGPAEAFTPEQLAALAPEDADASQVSDEITRIVALPAGTAPVPGPHRPGQ